MERKRKAKFKHAAVAYLIYGILYEGYALYSIFIKGSLENLTSFQYFFIGLGFILVILLPYLTYLESKPNSIQGEDRPLTAIIPHVLYLRNGLFTKILSILVALRAATLVGLIADIPSLAKISSRELSFLKKMSSDEVYASALVVTLITFFFLARAGWNLKPD